MATKANRPTPVSGEPKLAVTPLRQPADTELNPVVPQDPDAEDSDSEAFPLAPGHEERVPLYQLYPLMVHVNLFGGGYVPQVEGALARLV